MADFCTNPKDVENFSGMPNFATDATYKGTSTANDISASYMDLLNEQNEHINAVQQASSLIDALDGDISGQARVALENAGVTNVSNKLKKWLEDAITANERDYRYNFKDVADQISNSTVEDASRYAKLARHVTGLLTNERAEFIGYMQKYYGTEGSHVDMHPVIQNMNLARADYAGVMTQIQNFLDNTFGKDERLLKLAKDTGYDLEVLLDAGGHYANMEHAVERNVYGYERLKAERERISRKLLEEDDSKLLRELNEELESVDKKIKDYEAYAEEIEKPGNVSMPAGYTNAQARNDLAHYHEGFGLTVEDMQYMSSKMRDFSNFVEGMLSENGILTPQMVAELGTLPEGFTSTYVPYRTRKQNQSGALNDSDVYTSRKYQAFEGMTNTPDSAWSTLHFFAHRAAKDIGYKSFGQSLWATYMQGMKRANGKINLKGLEVGGIYDGLQALRYDNLIARALSGSTTESAVRARAILNTKEGGGGIVTTVPITDAKGNVKYERVLLNFDPNWEDKQAGLKGSRLNESLSVDEIQKDSQRLAAQIMTGATSSYGQLFTRFTPAFAPVNGMRDVAERLVNMLSRDYLDDSGKMVAGWTLAPKYVANTVRAFNGLYDVVTKSVNPDSTIAQLWNEYANSGLYMNPARHVGLESQPSKFNQNTGKVERRFVDNMLDAAGGAGRKVMGVLDGYNDLFNNIASFAQYMTLREAKVPQRRAASGVLEMMNLYSKGKSTDIARMLYPFVKPTLQSGVALMRTLGLSPDAKGRFRPNVKGFATFFGLYALATQLYSAVHRGLGKDEEGNWRADTMSMSQWQSYWPIPTGDDGEFVKLSNGFGLIQAAITAAVGKDRVNRGLMTPEDLAFEMMFAVGKNVVPGNFPEFNMSAKPMEWWSRMLAPAIAMPIVELASNTNYLGADIYFKKDQWTAKADSGLSTTQKNYHAVAKLVRNATGGIVDLAPEQYRALLNDLAIGPLRFISAAVDSGAIGVEDGGFKRKDTQRLTAAEDLGPWLTAMGMTRFYGKTGDTNRSLFYQALNAMQARARADGIDLSSAGTTGKEEGDEKRRQNLLNAGWSQEDAVDAVMLWRAERELRQVARNFSGSFDSVWNSSESSDAVKDTMDQYALDRIAIFRRVVQSLNYYKQTRAM